MRHLAWYLKVESGNPSNFKGDSKDRDHRDWIEVVDVSFVHVSWKPSGSPSRRAGRAAVPDESPYGLFITKSRERAPDGSVFGALAPTSFASVVLHVPGHPGHRFEFGGAKAGGVIGVLDAASRGSFEEVTIDFEAAYYRAGAASLPNAASSNFTPKSTVEALEKLRQLLREN